MAIDSDKTGTAGAPLGSIGRRGEPGTLARRRRQGAAATDLGGLEQMLGYVVRRAQLWMLQDLRRVLKSFGITPAQFSVMRVIAANPGLSQVRVAEALAIERARLVQMIDNLEAAGHVERMRSSLDRRSHALHLTPVGAELLVRAQAAADAHERNVTARIGPRDRDELLRILAPFVE